jgi:hypothetical protein
MKLRAGESGLSTDFVTDASRGCERIAQRG